MSPAQLKRGLALLAVKVPKTKAASTPAQEAAMRRERTVVPDTRASGKRVHAGSAKVSPSAGRGASKATSASASRGAAGKSASSKSGAQLGKGGGNRSTKVIRDHLKNITKGDLRRIARRAGCERMAAEIYNQTREALRVFLQGVLNDTIVYTDHAKRKTVITNDVLHSLRRRNTIMYGYQ